LPSGGHLALELVLERLQLAACLLLAHLAFLAGFGLAGAGTGIGLARLTEFIVLVAFAIGGSFLRRDTLHQLEDDLA
jgi:hypothetical protein